MLTLLPLYHDVEAIDEETAYKIACQELTEREKRTGQEITIYYNKK